MRKLLCMLLVLATVTTVFAGCRAGNDPSGSDDTQANNEATPKSALEVLEKVWALYADNEKMPVLGGNSANMTDNAPGKFDVANTEEMTFQLLVPADHVAAVTDCASMIHGMLSNNFTCGVFRVNGDAKAFADAMYRAIESNQWICGTPEKLLVASVGGEYVLTAFGLGELLDTLQQKLVQAYPETTILRTEVIA